MKYQVSLYVSPANLPFVFAKHSWFVVNDNGNISRWEVGFQDSASKTSWHHLYKDFLPPYTGIGIFPYSRRFLWPGHCLKTIDGDENSLAGRMANFISNSDKTYPYQKQYALTGPNSNTYTQWVLNHFPEFEVQLPWNSFGKNYDRREDKMEERN